MEGLRRLTACPGVYEVALSEPAPVARLTFEQIYAAHFDDAARWARALGGPDADLDDLAQEVFLVVEKKLAAFDGANLRGWLYAITARVVAAHRRRAWFRNIFMRPHQDDEDLDAFASVTADPARVLEDKQRHRALYRLLGKMSDKRREALVLFEVEGYSGDEVAALVGVPVATVWTRLHHARKDFLRLVEEARGAERQ